MVDDRARDAAIGPGPDRARRSRTGAVVAAALGFAACGRSDGPSPLEPVPVAAGVGSALPRLAATPSGGALLSWTEPAADGRSALRWAELGPGGFSVPSTAASGADWLLNWADFPSVTRLGPRALVAHWLRKRASGGYDIELARSDDDGASWSPPRRPYADDSDAEHGFFSLAPTAAGGAFAVWLDGRAFAGLPEDQAESRAAMALRGVALSAHADDPAPSAGANAERSLELDGRTCSCCQTAAVAVDGAVLVAYRDRSADEIRDIAVVRYRGGQASAPALVHDDGWRIDGCPVNGPALAARDATVAVAWYTAAAEVPQVVVALSVDGGRRFGPPARIDAGQPQGRVDVALVGSYAYVSWQEHVGAAVELRVRAVRLGPTLMPGAVRTVATVEVGRSTGFPQLLAVGADLIAAWTQREVNGETQVRAARLSAAALR